MKIFKALIAVSAGLMVPICAHAASTAAPTGVNAGFFSLQTDLTSILQGDGGAAIIVAGVLIGAAMLAFSARWTYIVSVLGVAVVLGYGFPVISSMAGVTADINMVTLSEPNAQSDLIVSSDILPI